MGLRKLRKSHDVGCAEQAYLGHMELLLIVLLLITFDLAAMRWGVDSRRRGWTIL